MRHILILAALLAATPVSGQSLTVLGLPDGAVRATFEGKAVEFRPFEPGFRGSYSLACRVGPSAADSRVYIGAGPGGGPRVTVRSAEGWDFGSFFAFEADYRGGVSVAVDKDDLIVTRAAPHPNPEVVRYKWWEPWKDTPRRQAYPAGLLAAAGDYRPPPVVIDNAPARITLYAPGVAPRDQTPVFVQFQTAYPRAEQEAILTKAMTYLGKVGRLCLTTECPAAGEVPNMYVTAWVGGQPGVISWFKPAQGISTVFWEGMTSTRSGQPDVVYVADLPVFADPRILSRSDRMGRILAHEVMHTFLGADHDPDQANLMAAGAAGDALRQDQIDKARLVIDSHDFLSGLTALRFSRPRNRRRSSPRGRTVAVRRCNPFVR